MAIADPHAVPEDAHTCAAYLHEADAAWDRQDSDAAFDLYWALTQSAFAEEHAQSHAALRLGLIAQVRGDPELAYHFLARSHEPGAADALHALTNATTDDPRADPDVVPQTEEQLATWWAAAQAAEHSGDHDLAMRLWVAAAACPATNATTVAAASASAGLLGIELGHTDWARGWLEAALPNLADRPSVDRVRAALKKIGVQVEAEDDSPASAQLALGRGAYEKGDAHGARAALEAALHLDGPDAEKARAHYYLGAMDYQQGRYGDARNHIEACLTHAPEPEQSWAQAALHWHWDETPAP